MHILDLRLKRRIEIEYTRLYYLLSIERQRALLI